MTRTLESMPRGATQWRTRSMAKASGMSNATEIRIWRAFRPQAAPERDLQASKDPLFVEKVGDIAGQSLHPPDRAVVLSVDE